MQREDSGLVDQLQHFGDLDTGSMLVTNHWSIASLDTGLALAELLTGLAQDPPPKPLPFPCCQRHPSSVGPLIGVLRPFVVIPSGGIAGRNSTEEDMVSDTTERGGSGHKTLAIRLDEAVHAQLSVIAQLRKSTITDEIRQAIEEHIIQVRSNPDLVVNAESALDDIERELSARKAAISALLGESEPAAPASTGRKTGRSGASEGRTGSEEKNEPRALGFRPTR